METKAKPKYIPILLGIWVIIAMIQFWFSSIFSTRSAGAAIGDAIGYTFVPIAIGFFLLRIAKTKEGVRGLAIIILGIFFVLLWGDIKSTNSELMTQMNSECAGSANIAHFTQSQKAKYCDCFTGKAVPITKSATRRATFGVTTGNPMEDQVFVNAMQYAAASCPLPTE